MSGPCFETYTDNEYKEYKEDRLSILNKNSDEKRDKAAQMKVRKLNDFPLEYLPIRKRYGKALKEITFKRVKLDETEICDVEYILQMTIQK